MEYRCYCSRERVEAALGCIQQEELEDMVAAGEDISVSCQFCDKTYSFSPEELKSLSQDGVHASDR